MPSESDALQALDRVLDSASGEIDHALLASVLALDGPLAAEAFALLFEKGESLKPAWQAALSVIRSTNDPGLMAEVTSCAVRTETPISDAGRRELWSAFAQRAEDAGADSGTRSQALRGALFVAEQDRGLLRRLQGLLLGISPNDDPHYLSHAAKISGLLLARAPDIELRELLMRLGEAAPPCDEACLEVGLDLLRAALEADGVDLALSHLHACRHWLQRALDESEHRVDTALYLQCIDILIAFHTGTDAAISPLLEQLQASALEHAHHVLSYANDWEHGTSYGLAATERVRWTMLAMRLAAVDRSLQKAAWLQASIVIEEELAVIYAASRTVLQRRNSGGLEVLIRPRIAAVLLAQRTHRECIEQWLRENGGSAAASSVAALLNDATAAMEKPPSRLPPEAAAVSAPAAAFESHALRDSIVADIASRATALIESTTSPVVAEILASIRAELTTNDHFQRYPDAGAIFEVIVYYTLLYAQSRHEVASGTLPRLSFLFARDPANLPKEKDLQRDYHEFLMASPLAAACQAEPRDLGGGRADVLFTCGGMKTVAELKRTLNNRDLEQLVADFGEQVTGYQTTNATFAMLLVLDLHDRAGNQPHLREQVSVHHFTPVGVHTRYTVVVFRIQGRRSVPSAL